MKLLRFRNDRLSPKSQEALCDKKAPGGRHAFRARSFHSERTESTEQEETDVLASSGVLKVPSQSTSLATPLSSSRCPPNTRRVQFGSVTVHYHVHTLAELIGDNALIINHYHSSNTNVPAPPFLAVGESTDSETVSVDQFESRTRHDRQHPRMVAIRLSTRARQQLLLRSNVSPMALQQHLEQYQRVQQHWQHKPHRYTQQSAMSLHHHGAKQKRSSLTTRKSASSLTSSRSSRSSTSKHGHGRTSRSSSGAR